MPMREQIKTEFKDMILRAMEYHFPGARVILFGSRATGTHREGSDVDIAVDAKVRIEPREVVRARLTLDNLYMPLNVDLVDLNAIPLMYQ
jgi:predicted nucleotidyltransferase